MQPESLEISTWKKFFIGFLILYSFAFLTLLIINFKDNPDARARIIMGAGLFLAWVCIGGLFQKNYLSSHYKKLTQTPAYPVLYFTFFATLLACIEEALATLMTNLAPLFGSTPSLSYITASTNFFHVIFLHSVIVFIPMFITLGIILKHYNISPWATFITFGIVGVLGEMTLAGAMVLYNIPFWVCIYGLMVYLPSYSFLHLDRKKPLFLLYPFFIIAILVSATATFWIPSNFDTDPIKHFTK